MSSNNSSPVFYRTTRISIALALAFNFVFLGLEPASAARASFSIQKYFSGSLETTIKFGSKDCINVPITYKASSSLGYPDHVIMLEIRNKSGSENSGAFASIELGSGDDFGGDDPYKGKINLRLCRAAGLEYDEDGESIPGTKPGTYYFQASITQLKPFLMLESKRILVKVTK
jgi:hypothetical protein